MEVTKENFDAVLPTLPDVFKKAQFIAFDTEFTGLRVEGSSSLNYFDTLEELYVNDKLRAETFIVIQYGLTVFFYNKETDKYTHQGYNFYIYPSSHSNINFTCDSHSIRFLTEHGFDFNKVFKYGIPYLKETELEQLLTKLKESQTKNQVVDNSTKIEIPSQHAEIINSIIQKVQELTQSKSKVSFETQKYNSFVRRLIYKAVEQEFGFGVFIETNKNETMTISVGFSPEEIKEKKREKYLRRENEILNEAGFCKVIKLLIESNKPLVGHNLLIDILFTIRQFVTPLPNTYNEFKDLVKFLFPKLIDTKYMAATSFKQISDTALSTVLKNVEELIPQVEVAENGIGYMVDDEKLHEASYDAFLTGLCFLAMSKNLGNINSCSNIFNNLPESPILEPVINKLSTPKLCDIFFMNLGGTDIVPDRVGVYHLSFPKEWMRQDITELFKNCGFINISWLNNTSAFIKVKKEYIPEVEQTIMNKNSVYKIMTYTEFRSSNSNTPKILSSPVMEKSVENNVKISPNNDSPFKGVSNKINKRKIEEDIGEVIERQPKRSK